MKNLPETNFWNRIKARLENYEEVPADDAWDKIAGAMPPMPSRSNKGKKAFGVAVIFLAGTFAGIGVNHYLIHNEQGSSVSNADSLKVSESLHDERNAVTNDSSKEIREQGHAMNVEEETLNGVADDQRTNGQMDIRQRQAHDVAGNDDHDFQGRKVVTSSVPTANDGGVQAVSSSNEIDGTDEQTVRSNTSDHFATTTKAKHGVTASETSMVIMEKTAIVRSDNQQHTDKLAATVNEIHDGGSSRKNNSAGANASVANDNEIRETTPSEEINAGDEQVIDPNTSENNNSPAVNSNVAKSEATIAKPVKQGNEDQQAVDSVRREKKSPTEVKASSKKSNELRKPKILKGANLYAIVTPSLSFQEITPSTNDDVEVIDFESPGVMAKERFGWSLDVGYQSVLRKHLEWYAGLSYYQQQQTLTYRYKTGEFDLISTDKGHAMIPKIATRSFSYNMSNVGVSAGLFYTIKHGGLQHKFGAGLLFQRGLLKSGEEQSYNNASTTYFNYQLSYRLEMAIKPKWNVFLQPTFIHSIYSNEGLKEPFELKPYRAGIGLGVIYRF